MTRLRDKHKVITPVIELLVKNDGGADLHHLWYISKKILEQISNR